MVKKEITPEKALQRLIALCNRSEQCEADIDNKMINWGLSSTPRKEIIENLRQQNLINNARFAKAYASDKARFSFWGPQKIRAELIKRRISAPIISSALKNIDPSIWKSGLLHNARSKAKGLDLLGYEGRDNRQKLYHYLISRGFPSSVVFKAVSFIAKKQEES